MDKWSSIIKLLYIPNFNIGNGNQIKFKTQEEQMQFFESHIISEYVFNDVSYVRTEGGTVRLPINADKFNNNAPNWMMFQNKDFSDKWYFANITDSLYISPEVMDISYSIDYFQTYQFNITLKKSYVARRTWDGTKQNEIINLPMEDLDIGNEYLITDIGEDTNGTSENFTTGQFFYIMLTKPLTTEKSTHNIITGNVILPDGKGGTKTISNGQNMVLYGYIMNYKCLNESINKGLFQKDCDLVNALQLIIQLPYGREMFPSVLNNIYKSISTTTNPNFGQNLPAGCELYEQTNFGWLSTNKTIKGLFDNLCNIINKITKQTTKGKPKSAIGQYLLRYPYSLLQVYDYYNQADTLKLDCLSKNNTLNSEYDFITNGLKIHKYGSIGQTPTLAYSIENYMNNSNISNYVEACNKGGLPTLKAPNMYTIQSNNSLPIINDYLTTFMQSNQNQINAQRLNLRDSLQTQINNAGASLQASSTSIALTHANAVYEATQRNIASMENRFTSFMSSFAQTGIRTAAQTADTMINSAMGGISNATQAVMGGIGGNTAQAISGGLGVASQYTGMIGKMGTIQADAKANMIAASAQNSIDSVNANASYMIGINTAQNIAEANNAQAQAQYGNSLRASQTSYNNEIRALNARVQDAKNIPANLQTMGNNASLFNILNDRDSIGFVTKTLPETVLKRISEYFILNGFITNKIEDIDLLVKDFTNKSGIYIQTVNCNIEGNVPSDALINIKLMMDGGVFIWNKENYMNYDAIYQL